MNNFRGKTNLLFCSYCSWISICNAWLKLEVSVGVLHRCQLWEKELEIKEMKEQLKELVGLLRQSESRRKEVEKELKLREQAVAFALASQASVRLFALCV